jgi:hypothetical protein
MIQREGKSDYTSVKGSQDMKSSVFGGPYCWQVFTKSCKINSVDLLLVLLCGINLGVLGIKSRRVH